MFPTLFIGESSPAPQSSSHSGKGCASSVSRDNEQPEQHRDRLRGRSQQRLQEGEGADAKLPGSRRRYSCWKGQICSLSWVSAATGDREEWEAILQEQKGS